MSQESGQGVSLDATPTRRILDLSTSDLGQVNAVRRSATLRFSPRYCSRPLYCTELTEMVRQGLAWGLWVEGDLAGVAYGVRFDTEIHLEFLGTKIEHSGKGYGHVLMKRFHREAMQREMQRTTLVTSSSVRWNQPYYERFGYRILPANGDLPEYLRDRLHEQTERFAGNQQLLPRVAMVRAVEPRATLI